MLQTIDIKKITPNSDEFTSFSLLHSDTYGRLGKSDIIDPSGVYYVACDENEKPLARISCHVSDQLYNTNGLTGIIGHYESPFDDTGILLLEHAKETLYELGCRQIIGPMNTNTWFDYRLITQCQWDTNSFPSDLFFSERPNKKEYADHFRSAGFVTGETTESRITTTLTHRAAESATLEKKLNDEGYTIRSIEMDKFDEELEHIYYLSIEAFAQNPYYTQIALSKFRQLYEEVEKIIDPDLVKLIYDKSNQCVGFAFAMKNLYSPDSVILKSIATSNRTRGIGMGLLLFDKIHLEAAKKGYTSVIHAFMHQDNISRKLSMEAYNSDPMHIYELFIHNSLDS